MKAIGRLYQYFDFKGIKPTRFEKDFGLSNGYFSIQLRRDADIGSSILEKIIYNCRDLNIDWLITGNGNMIIAYDQTLPLIHTIEEPNPGSIGSPGCERCKMKDKLIVVKDELIESLRQQIETQSKLIGHLEEVKSSLEYGQKRKAAS